MRSFVPLLQYIDLFHKLAHTEAKDNLDDLLSELSFLKTFKDRVAFAEKHFEHLSSGSARVVFKIKHDGKDAVLKLAKNERGLAQNIAEANPEMKSPYINETIRADKNGIWKISPFLQKITEKEFENLSGVPFKDFSEAISYGLQNISGNKHSKPKNFDKVKESDVYKELVKLGNRFHLLGGDMGRISSWAVRDKHPVLIDAGLTSEIYNEFYDKSTGTLTSSKTRSKSTLSK